MMKHFLTITNIRLKSKSFDTIDRLNRVRESMIIVLLVEFNSNTLSCFSCTSVVRIFNRGEKTKSLSYLRTRRTGIEGERFFREISRIIRRNEMATKIETSTNSLLVFFTHVLVERYFIQLCCLNQYSGRRLLSI